MRPTYETQEDRERQTSTIAVIERRWNCVATALKAMSPIDYALCRGREIRAWAEVKVRTNPAGKYPDYMLSLHKWQDGIRQSEFTGLPFFLVVGFTDGVRFVRGYKDLQVKYAIGGRTDRNDPADIEPVVLIDMRHFTLIDPAASGSEAA